MRIEIDTREESADSLRRIARFLEQLADESSVSTRSASSEHQPPTSSSDAEQAPIPAAFGLFDEEEDDSSKPDEEVVERADADDGFRVVPY